MNNIVYHGSHIGGLKEIKKHKSTHNIEAVYASPNISIPLAFIRNKNNGDLDLKISISNDKLQIVERRPGLLNKIYNLEGYIYELSSKNFKHYDYLWSPEVVSEKNEIVLKELYFPSIIKELEKLNSENKIELFKYPERPINTPLDNSDLIEHCLHIAKKYNKKDLIERLITIYPHLEESVNLKSNKQRKK